MKILSFLIPSMLGLFAVLQAGLNRKIAQNINLTTAVFLNSLLVFVFSVAIMLYVRQSANEVDSWSFDVSKLNWWVLIPALMGISFVIGVPFAIREWGATHTFIILVSAQLVASLLWDWQIEQQAIAWPRIAGCVLAWVGVFLANS